MMRSFIIGMISLVAVACGPKEYRIEGKCVDPEANGVVVLIAYGEDNKLDTIGKGEILNGKFLITGSVLERKVGYLLINDRLKDYIPIILENETYQMVLDGNVVVALTGTDEQDVMNKYLTTRIETTKLLEEFRQRPLDDRRNDSIKRMYREWDSEKSAKMEEEQLKLLEEYPDRYATALFFNLNLRDKGLKELNHIYGKLSGPGKDNTYAEKILQRIEKLNALEVGALSPNFSLKTPNDETVVMHEVVAKVKIIDFWASWCYPCRKENPFMVELYKKYHDKGLEIIGVSLDTERKRWVDAIEKDGLPWIQVSALKKWKCESVYLYDVRSVPHTVILDSQNRIIARNVRGGELEKLIAELLGNQ